MINSTERFKTQVSYILQEFDTLKEIVIESKSSRGAIVLRYDDSEQDVLPSPPTFEHFNSLAFLPKRKLNSVASYKPEKQFLVLFARMDSNRTDLFKMDFGGKYAKI